MALTRTLSGRLGRFAAPLLLALMGAHIAAALDPGKTLTQYAHRIWGQEEGLFQPTIYSILQTRDGFLWLGTQDSLIRFDGVHFREFHYRGEAVLHGSLIRSLAEDRTGNLWIGTVGNGLARIAPDGSFKHYGGADGLPASNIFCLAFDRDNQLWICTDKGLVRFDGRKFSLLTNADGLPAAGVRATCEASGGTRWVAGLNYPLMHWTGKKFEQYAAPGLPAVDSVTELECAKDGSVWVGTLTGLIHIENGKSQTFTVRDGLPDNTVSSLAEAPDGSLWVGTDDGISRYSKGDIGVYRTRDGLSHSVVLSLYQDKEGSLWAGTKDGLDQFTNPKVTPYTVSEGMSSNEASAIVEDLQGRLWVGTLDRGLNVFDGHRFRTITERDGLAGNTILSLALDRNGDIWAGTSKGLNRLKGEKVAAAYTVKNGLSDSEIRALYVDERGVLWIGTGTGLDSFDGRSFTRRAPALGNRNGILALTGSHSLRLLVSTDTDRLTYLQRDVFESYPLSGITRPVACFFVDSAHNSIWMGTLGSGLLRWHNGALARLRVRDGLYDSRIYAIVADGKSNFWMASSKGIFRIGSKELEDFADGKIRAVTSIPFSTGQLRFECRSGVQPSAWRTHDGRLWFSTTSGLVVVDPNHLGSNSIPPPVRITTVLVNGRPLSAGDRLRLKPAEKNLEIRYAGLSFIAPEKMSFRYMLDGYGKTWIDAGARREAFFTNLPPGDFRFKVMARNSDGLWSTQAAVLDFSVQPLLYQRRWFFPAAAMLLALFTVAVYRARVRRLRQRFDLVLTERNRIARELHDTLLQGISGVTMQLQALWMRLPSSRERDTLGEIIKDAGTCSIEARESLWGLRGSETQASLFSNKLADLSREAVADLNIDLLLRLDSVSLFRFPEIEFQLLRIAREAIQNSVKHSQAKTLEVDLRMNRRELRMTLADDGDGFDPETEFHHTCHFGLLGMRERAEEIGAVLEILTEPNCGTRIIVRLPLGRSGMQESNLEPVVGDRVS